nr:hypothetical protein [Tanacetum cinerariifolium]
IVMENPNQLNDPNVPKGEQAPAAPDGFAPQWIGEHDLDINNGWIEWDVPLGGEVDEPMVDPEVNEEVMDDDDWDVKVEWLMAPVTPSRATMTVSSTYEVGGPSTAAIERPSFPLPAPGLPVPPTVIEDLESRLDTYPSGQMTVLGQDMIARLSEQLRTRVAEMESHMGIVMPYMLWMEERLTVLEKRLPRPPSGPR